MTLKDKLSSSLVWGFILWLIGYLAGILLFFVVPKEYIGLIITPFATLITIYVLLKKIKRTELMCYFGAGVVWALMAIFLDYIFIVKMLGAGMQYYKTDVFVYYGLTFILPLIVGYWKFKHKPIDAELF